MSLLVIDASVAAKWAVPGEPLANEALRLLNRYTAGELRFVVPGLFWAEFGNILWKAAGQGRITNPAGEAAILALRQRKLPTVASESLLDQAFMIATAFRRTVYDSLYVALAVNSKAQLITADEKLANALAAHLPVKWLGSA